MPRLFEYFLSLVPWIVVLVVLVGCAAYWVQKLRRQAIGSQDNPDEEKLLDLETLRREGNLTDSEYRALRDRLQGDKMQQPGDRAPVSKPLTGRSLERDGPRN